MDPVKVISGNGAEMAKGTHSRPSGAQDFSKILKSLYDQTNQQLLEADQMARELAVGKRQDLHEVMIAGQKADLSFRFLMQIRNKLLDAYQEVMRMSF
jgi:flagellar hook-basal body complex protein FliE